MVDPERGGYKYAALVLPNLLGGPHDLQMMRSDQETLVGRLSSLVPEEQLETWRTWLGSLAWERIDSENRLVILRAPSERPDVQDGETIDLCRRVEWAWTALLLCGVDPRVDDDAWVFSGAASSGVPGSPLLTVLSSTHLEHFAPLLHGSRAEYRTKIGVPRLKMLWETTGKSVENRLQEWSGLDQLLSGTQWPPVLFFALLAFTRARTEPQIEFALPGLVRAAEGVLAIPKGPGASVFAERAVRLVPALASDPYVGMNVDQLLVQLYYARNDCVHGKVPFAALRQLGEAGLDEGGRMTYAAELLAREGLLRALRFADQSVFASRDALETAWRLGTFP